MARLSLAILVLALTALCLTRDALAGGDDNDAATSSLPFAFAEAQAECIVYDGKELDPAAVDLLKQYGYITSHRRTMKGRTLKLFRSMDISQSSEQ